LTENSLKSRSNAQNFSAHFGESGQLDHKILGKCLAGNGFCIKKRGTLDHYVPQSSRPYWYYLEPLVGFSTSKPCVCCAYFYWKMSTSADHSTRSAHD
ncbi:hypothetical protein T11_13273, partial [Trichinella zimbabwensis]